MTRVLLIFFIATAITAQASTDLPCGPNHLAQLYRILLEKRRDSSITGYNWMHRAVLYEAACITKEQAKDTALVARKMRLAWQQLSAQRISSASEPAYYFYELIGLALHTGYGPLLLDAVRWGIDLNHIDTTTHQTVLNQTGTRQTLLNQLEAEYRNSTTTQRADWIREYKQLLLAGGAKYFAEVDFIMHRISKLYAGIRPPVYGLFPVQQKGKWGWVDQHNKTIIPLRYAAVRVFTAEVFEVSDDGKQYYFINRKGERVSVH